MNDLQNLLGNVLGGPWANAQASQQYNLQQDAAQSFARQMAAYPSTPYAVPSPEEAKQAEIKRKNKRNYALWLARILRDPLTDCVAGPWAWHD